MNETRCDEERTRALLDAVRALSESLRVAEVGARLVDLAIRLGGASAAELVLDARPGSSAEPARVFELDAHGESVGRLRVFGADSLDEPALRTLCAHAAVALANARTHEAALVRADHDTLTGLANYGRIVSALEQELGRAQRYGRALAVAMFDIDDLKGWNDRFGHAAGNAALVRVARLLRERSRVSDTAGRYGGDELVLVLPETTSDGAVAVAEKVRAAFESLSLAAEAAPLSVSAGVASAPADGKTAAELLAAADTRLYRAKAEGRNRVIA